MHVYPDDISSAELTRCASNYYVPSGIKYYQAYGRKQWQI